MAGCVALLCLMLAEPAFSQRDCQAPPGRSGLDQYCESVPGATGEQGPGAGGGAGRDVSPSTRRRLERSGAAGQALLGVIGGPSGGDEKSAASGDGGGKSSRRDRDAGGKSSRGSSESDNQEAADEPSNDVLSAVRSAADSGASTGPVFIWVLVAVAVAIAGVAWIRYRVRGGAR